VVSLPYPAAVLVYGGEDAMPDSDADKAGAFMTKVLQKIEDVILKEVELFERSFGVMEEK